MEAFTSGNLGLLDYEEIKPLYDAMANDIKFQQSRIGGDFACAFAVHSRQIRDNIRKILPEVIFVTLTLTEECQLARLMKRHGDTAHGIAETMAKVNEAFELPGENEENTFNIAITESMEPTDVVSKTLALIGNDSEFELHTVNHRK